MGLAAKQTDELYRNPSRFSQKKKFKRKNPADQAVRREFETRDVRSRYICLPPVTKSITLFFLLSNYRLGPDQRNPLESGNKRTAVSLLGLTDTSQNRLWRESPWCYTLCVLVPISFPHGTSR